MKVGIIQQANTANIEENIRNYQHPFVHLPSKGRIDVMQEIHNGLYFCQTEDTDVFDQGNYSGPSTNIWCIGKGVGSSDIVIIVRKACPWIVSTSCGNGKDGSIAGKYRKMHPRRPAYYEKFYFLLEIWFRAHRHISWSFRSIICWDQWYPEAARLMALAGAEVLIYPTAIGWESSDTEDEKQRQLDAWVTIQRSHAVANGLPMISVNRTGYEPDPSGQTNGITFWGNSFVCGPQGELLYTAPHHEDVNHIVEIDKTRTENVRRW